MRSSTKNTHLYQPVISLRPASGFGDEFPRLMDSHGVVDIAALHHSRANGSSIEDHDTAEPGPQKAARNRADINTRQQQQRHGSKQRGKLPSQASVHLTTHTVETGLKQLRTAGRLAGCGWRRRYGGL
ncbi:hypothetical protein Vretifemale_16604 [Volvox reticuliferus]|uniref:Uncharacterized protein n=1 Tax=Volvox reticuliferus TaxID=1737510 RepID=A0A8J4CZL3_9CHLO|nr:hypothetical protein Vretifemale_16604 [Volvox reticuliferus]